MIKGESVQGIADAARAMGSVKTERKTASSRRTLAQAREALQADPEAKERQRAAVSAAQKARWDEYRAKKQAEKAAQGA